MATDTPRDNSALRGFKSIVFTLVGVGLMISAVCWAVFTWQFMTRAASAQDVVVKLNVGGAHSQMRFTAAAGEVAAYPQGGMIWGYRAGDSAEMLYAPENSKRGPVIRTTGALWGFSPWTSSREHPLS